jgi:hypothetical protein
LDQIPRPYVLEPPDVKHSTISPGDRFEFGIVLVGRAIGYLPYFVFSFNALGEVGLGPDRGKFSVAEVHQERPHDSLQLYEENKSVLRHDGNPVTAKEIESRYETGRSVTIHFLTPTRIISDGQPSAVLTFAHLIRALLRRLSSLCYFHCGSELSLPFAELKLQAESVVTAQSALTWRLQDRFSGRQGKRIDSSGLEGSVTFEAPSASILAKFLPLLAAGEWAHVGKGCVMGLGKYHVEVHP